MSKVKTILKRFAYLREYKVLSDVTVKTVQGEHKFDHIMIGPFGILSLCCFNKKGELYGNENDENFVLLDAKMNRTKTENLIRKAKEDERVLRALVTQAKLYNVKIDTAIVIENKGCKSLIPTAAVPVLQASQLSKFLNTDKFEMDNKADALGIASAIEQ